MAEQQAAPAATTVAAAMPDLQAQRKRTLLANGALLLTTTFWGMMVPLTALLLAWFDPFLLGGLRYALALPFLWLFVALSRERVSWRGLTWGRLTGLGLSMAGFSMFYNLGVAHSHPVTASVVLMCGPFVAAIMARFLFNAPLERSLLLALPVTVAGGIVVALGARASRLGGEGAGVELSMGFGGGEPLLILAQVCWTWYSLRAQHWLSHLGQLRLSALSSTVGAAWMMAFYFLLWGLGIAGAPAIDVPLEGLAALAWISFTGVALAIVMWNFGTSIIGVPQAALYLNLQPVTASLTAAAMGAPPSLMQVAGGVVVMAAVFYVQTIRLKALGHAAR